MLLLFSPLCLSLILQYQFYLCIYNNVSFFYHFLCWFWIFPFVSAISFWFSCYLCCFHNYTYQCAIYIFYYFHYFTKPGIWQFLIFSDEWLHFFLVWLTCSNPFKVLYVCISTHWNMIQWVLRNDGSLR